MALTIKPITFREANRFVNLHHRHHAGTVGCKFCVAVWSDDVLAGVAICGRPVSRKLDNGLTLEINRVCTLAVKNACSKLYGACIRIGKEMGYKKLSLTLCNLKTVQALKLVTLLIVVLLAVYIGAVHGIQESRDHKS